MVQVIEFEQYLNPPIHSAGTTLPSIYLAGTTLQVRGSTGTYWHYGISDGCDGVIHKPKGQPAVHESLAKFSEGQQIHVSPHITSQDLPLAYQKAETFIGEEFSLFFSNCEHLVRKAHGLPTESKQVGNHILAAGAIYALYRILK